MKKLSFIIALITCTQAFAQKKITVDQKGGGDYTTVQAAFKALPAHNTTPVTIYIKNGTYREKLKLDSGKSFVHLVGESTLGTILTYDDHPAAPGTPSNGVNTQNSYSFQMNASNFMAKDITFRNDAGFSAGQAVAVEARGDKAVFLNCSFVGNQDILFLNNENARQYFKNCYIEGTTDFIFGPATVWFEGCHIHSKKNSHITAASTPQSHPYGYIFNDCKLTGDTSLHMVSLGRPWRPYSMVIYMRCYMGPQIKPEGFSNWNQTESYKTARYAEYKSTGPGGSPAGRVTWAKQLTAAEADQITLKSVFPNWDPLSVK